MHPVEFVEKWRGATLSERAAAQQHFLDLCRVLDVPPADVNRHDQTQTFEMGHAHAALDRAAWAADEVEEDVILSRLMALNGERAGLDTP